MGADPLEPTDEDTEAGRVEELDALHVHHQVVLAAAHEVDELLTQLRRRVDVDLATHDDDGAVTLGPGRQGQVHGSPPCSRRRARRPPGWFLFDAVDPLGSPAPYPACP